ncbi:4-hydroxy-3-methylbut-2-enyl diphosphate reductase [Alienimonas californiensis]|uniref:4-hydroxy-3-methylbut-2-enyl diphosphate reductase n=1 Tax=Alienimonas californiensis TaxID=2527989 RepID=A0A517PDI6_9PLAN|nr:4-hydroxy-3-methylbut-2-enyl diphosphate reductase [Alienimonas californiensis]QDT17430.1 4-hydroxy-3-methylbut-2-enyl diphosphate reductase [Alienimonas californiensis]
MHILLANPRGFCAGVNMAVDALDLAVERFGGGGPRGGEGIYVYHEIVHNKAVVERFTSAGVTFVEHVEDVPEGSVLMYSAHGVSPEIREAAKARKLFTIDATCPLVTKVHIEAIRYAKAGYHIMLIGHEGHDEVIGTMGEAPESITLVDSPEEVDALSFPPRPDGSPAPLAVLTQTTLSVDEAGRVMKRLRERFPHLETPRKEDICYATTNRQEAVRKLAERSDLLLVLGSKNSSNSLRLVEIGQECGIPGHLLDGPDELRDEWFLNSAGEPFATVLVTAGASAPERVVTGVVEALRERFGATISEETLRTEHVRFPLPKELRPETPGKTVVTLQA